MLSIFICENDSAQRSKIELIIKNYIMIEELDMELVLSTNNPYDIMDYLNHNRNVKGIYFLDVDLGYDINGIQLGSYIREKNLDVKIVFITTHSELLYLTFTYKVEAMDYILKDDDDVVKSKIISSLIHAQKHYHSDIKINRVKLKIGNQFRFFQIEDIIYFETSSTPHKLIMHLNNSTIDFYGKINEMESIDSVMLRVHKSYVINVENIKLIDKSKREIIMSNGDICLLSTRQIKRLESTIMSK